jgi:hypothetical protein
MTVEDREGTPYPSEQLLALRSLRELRIRSTWKRRYDLLHGKRSPPVTPSSRPEVQEPLGRVRQRVAVDRAGRQKLSRTGLRQLRQCRRAWHRAWWQRWVKRHMQPMLCDLIRYVRKLKVGAAFRLGLPSPIPKAPEDDWEGITNLLYAVAKLPKGEDEEQLDEHLAALLRI